MTDDGYPILYSFRRCPYAMRARMALYVSQQVCTHREVVLRDKPDEMIAVSPKATVPVLEVSKGEVIDQSLDIMLWALKKNDPEGWLQPVAGTLDDMLSLITRCEDEFKPHLDRYKYANRYEGADPISHRTAAESYLKILEQHLSKAQHLFGDRPALADYALFPFIRQFANTDRSWFDQTSYPNLHTWLESFLNSEMFFTIMKKYPQWKSGDDSIQTQISA